MAKYEVPNGEGTFKLSSELNESDIAFYSVREKPFRVYGLYGVNDGEAFKRMSVTAAKATSDSVANLNYQTAGGRVRFSTNSKYIAIRAYLPSLNHMAHMPLSGSSGFDMYVSGKFCKLFMPPTKIKDGYEDIMFFSDKKMRTIEINFPLYNGVENLFIGLQENAVVKEGAEYKYKKHVVYYGSSITQGGCASRPGNAYEAIISRKLDCNYINFGFSGSAKGEESIANYIADLEMSVFVMDYDHNAPSGEHLANTHERMFKAVRAKSPKLPIILVSRPNTDFGVDVAAQRREIIFSTYINAIRGGDKNVWFIDGASLFMGEYRDCCTVDGCHPNDAGFVRMADIIGQEIEKCLKGVQRV